MPDELNPQTEGSTQATPPSDDLSAMFRGFSDAILEQVEAKLQAATKPAETTPDAPASTLTQRIAQLEKQLAEKAEAEAKSQRQASYDNAFKTELGNYQLAFPIETESIVKGLMANELELVEGKWLSKDGKSLQERLNGFFNTPFGQHLLKAPTGQTGSGTQPSNNPRQSPSPDTRTAIGRLFGLA